MSFEKYFQMAVDLAFDAKGTTSPNPSVGCVLVKDGRILSTGATQKAGSDHAEVMALKTAGSEASGSTLYVTLEPCVDFPGKRTPSCTGAIIRSGVRSVVVGMTDPNPAVNGRGIEELRAAGIETRLLDHHSHPELIELNEDFIKYIRTGLPFLTAKYAMTADGAIADLQGVSRWISGPESRHRVHLIRSRTDAVMVGVRTVLSDDPMLNVRHGLEKRDPLRIIIDPRGRTKDNSRVMSDSGRSLFIIGPEAPSQFRDLCDRNGREYMMMDTGADGHFDMKSLMKALGARGITSILLEGGGKLLYECLRAEIIDKFLIFIAPILLGGQGLVPFNGNTSKGMPGALKLKRLSVENIGEDILLKGYPE